MTNHEFIDQLKSSKAIVYKACNLYCKGIDYADIVQDIYLQAWQSMPSFKKQSSFKTWLWSIARNVCIDNFKQRQKAPIIEELKDYEEIIGSSNNYSELVLQLRQAIKYDTVMDKLDESDRCLLEMYIHGLSYKEISAQTGISENNLTVRVNRIKQRLRLRYGNKISLVN